MGVLSHDCGWLLGRLPTLAVTTRAVLFAGGGRPILDATQHHPDAGETDPIPHVQILPSLMNASAKSRIDSGLAPSRK